MFDPASFVRVAAFSVIFAGIEYRYINRREEEWPRTKDGFFEKPAFWVISPYQAYLLLPLFMVVSFAPPVSAWAGNTFLTALLEDAAYFVWRGKGVQKSDWTTTLFGSFKLGDLLVPTWWPLAGLLVAALYFLPF